MKKIFFINNNNNFFEDILIFSKEYFKDLSKVVFVLNDDFASTNMQNLFIKIFKYSVVPAFISINSLKKPFTYLNKNIATITDLEIEINFCKIISDYPQKPISFKESLNILPKLISLYNEIKILKIELKDLDLASEYDIAQHWQDTYDFLSYLFSKFDEYILANNIKLKNEILIDNIKNSEKKVFLFVGISDFSCNIEDIKKIFLYNNTYFFLPQFTESDYKKFDQKSYNKLSPIFENYQNIISNYEHANISKNYKLNSKKKLEIIEFNNIFDEANFVFYESILTNLDKKINIILNNEEIAYILAEKLEINNIEFNSSYNKSLSNYYLFNFLIKLSQLKYSKLDLIDFMKLLRSHFLYQNEEINILIEKINHIVKQKLNNENSLNYQSFVDKIINNHEIQKLDIYHKFLIPLGDFINKKNDNLKEEFFSLITFVDKISFLTNLKSKELFYQVENLKVILSSFKQLKENYFFENDEFNKFLEHLFSKSPKNIVNRNSNINILKINEALYVNGDVTIIMDFNIENYLKTEDNDPWFGEHIKKKLKILDNKDNFENIEYIFKIISEKASKLIVTRSCFIKGVQKNLAPFLDDFRIINYKSKLNFTYFIEKNLIQEQSNFVQACNRFPSKLYPTNIELLIRNPYGFFAKKILYLNKKEDPATELNYNDFGNIVHEIFDKINKSEDLSIKSIVETSYLNNQDKKILINILEELCKFFVNYQLNCKKENIIVFSETEFVKYLKIDEFNQYTLKAKIDRLEIDNKNKKIKIIDFKTGSVPSIQSVKSGIFPQLIVESIIILYGNNPNIPSDILSYKLSCSYFKITTNYPFISETEIEIIPFELETHLNEIIDLIKSYVKNGEFYKNQAPKSIKMDYNDYKHFSRFKD